MAWSSLSSNQLVTEGDMAQSDMPLKANQSHGSGNKCMTKSELINKYNLDLVELVSYTDPQLVQKQNIISGVTGFAVPVSHSQYQTAAEACSYVGNTAMATLYKATDEPVANGMILYIDSGLTQPFQGLNLFQVIGDNVGRLSNTGVISEYQSCSILPTRYSCGISMGDSTSSAACKSVTSSIIFLNSLYTVDIAIGDICYTSASGDTVFVGNPYKWYKIDNGDGAYAVQINSLGRILNTPLACGF